MAGIHSHMESHDEELVTVKFEERHNDYIFTLAASDIAYHRLLPVLAQCFAVIFVGYLSGKFGVLSVTEAQGISIFVRTFSLPSLIFFSVAEIDLSNINWDVLTCLTLSKSIVFIIVVVLTLILTNPTNVGKAGLYGIFCTQSNDLCLGLPLIKILYSHDHPEYIHYLYLLAPVQLMLLNPIGFLLMELQRQQDTNKESRLKGRLALALSKSIFFNPVVVMTFLSIIANVEFNHTLPVVVKKFFEVIGKTFPGTALFLLGHSLCGKCSVLKGSSLLTPVILILTKILVLPLIIRQIVNAYPAGKTPYETKELSNFGFLYGTFPTAPTVYIFASQYDMPTEVVAAGMVAATLLSAPLMFVSASMTTLAVSNAHHFHADLINTMLVASILNFICSSWVLGIFIMGRKWKKVTHGITICLVVSQLLTATGGLFWSTVNFSRNGMFYFLYILTLWSVLASRIWTALVAVILAILYSRSLCFALRMRACIMIIGFSLSVLLALFLGVGLGTNYPSKADTDPSFHFGKSQASVAGGVMFLSFAVSLISLVIHQRSQNLQMKYHTMGFDDGFGSDNNSGTNIQEGKLLLETSPSDAQGGQDGTLDIEDIGLHLQNENVRSSSDSYPTFSCLCDLNYACNPRKRRMCKIAICKYRAQTKEDIRDVPSFEDTNDHQIFRHVILVVLLCISMLVGIAVCFWKLIMEEKTGIYVELEFLDVILNYGQGVFTFAVFGLDSKLIISPCLQVWRRVFYGTDMVVLPEVEELTPTTRRICQQFVAYHYEKCSKELETNRTVGNSNYKAVFSGREFVDWLINVGLAHDRKEAEVYGQHLLLGRVIQHVRQRLYFHDDDLLYRFLPKLN